MAKDKDKKKEKPKRGCVPQLFFAISGFASVLMAVALVFMVVPQDIWSIDGYGEGAQNREARDLTAVLRESVDRGHQVTISEDELNRWIGQTLKMKQKGLLGPFVKVNGLGIHLREDEAEIVIERSFLGLKTTHSMFVQVKVEADEVSSSKEAVLHGGPIADFFPALKRGGRFGRLTVPQGYLYLVKPTFFQLGEVYKEEINLAFRKMHDIKVEEGQLVLTPRKAMMAPDSP